MKNRIRVAAALVSCAFLVLSGCASSPEVTKKEPPPGLSVRLPATSAAKLDIESQSSLGRPELPLSMADESSGRWLHLFEVNYSPAKSASPPLPIGEEEQSR
jgi:hypothetical protein